MRFRRYAAARIGAAFAVLALAVVLVFVLFHVLGLPEDGFRGKAAARYAQYSQEDFGDFIWRLVGHASLGRSILENRDVAATAFDAARVTLTVTGWALILGLLLAVPLALVWSFWPSWTFGIPRLFAAVAASLFPAWIGLVLLRYPAYEWNVFPLTYPDTAPHVTVVGGAVRAWSRQFLLPGLALGLPVAALYTRVLRALVRDARRAVRAAEPDERPAATRRASARVAITLSKALLRDVGYLIGAAVLVEEVFGLPGLGRTLVSAVAGGDGAMAEGILIVGTLIGVGVALLGNLVGGAISSEWRSGS